MLVAEFSQLSSRNQLILVIIKPMTKSDKVEIGRKNSISEDGVPQPEELGNILNIIRERKNQERKTKNLNDCINILTDSGYSL